MIVPDPKSDADQLRFAQIRSRMLDNLVKHLPDYYIKIAGLGKRDDLRDKMAASDSIMCIIDSCVLTAQEIEGERSSGR